MTTRTSIRRILPMVVAAGMTVSLAACSGTGASQDAAPSAAQPAASADTAMSAAPETEQAPTYERKRGEALEPLQKDWLSGDQTTDSSAISLPLNNVFHDVRGGEHPDFYRVVVEFKRDSTPGKRAHDDVMNVQAKWTDTAISQGKGDKLENSGQAFLDVVLDGTTMAHDADLQKLYYTGDSNVTFGPIDVSIDGSYEGRTHVVIGMDKQRDYQMTFLEGPTRLVIDLKK